MKGFTLPTLQPAARLLLVLFVGAAAVWAAATPLTTGHARPHSLCVIVGGESVLGPGHSWRVGTCTEPTFCLACVVPSQAPPAKENAAA